MRIVEIAHLTVCESGHVMASEPTGTPGVRGDCPNCGSDTRLNENFCGACGSAIPADTKLAANAFLEAEK